MTPDAAAIPLPISDMPDLDLRGLRCPLPVLRTRKALAALAPGGVMRVASTDPLAGLDIPHLIRQTGDILVEQRCDGDVQIFVIRKA